MKCDYADCDNDAEFWNPMDNQICEACMHREIEEDPELEYDDFERIN